MKMAKVHISTPIWVLVVVAVRLCSCDNTTISDGSGKSEPSKTPIDQGMEPLYIMTTTFLDIVHPASRGLFTNAVGVSISTLLDKPEEVLDTISDWQPWAKHYVGFAACAVVGILYIIIMPIVGCCFCICRCAGKCGARSHKNPEKGSQKYKRICCGLFLLLFNTLMLAGMVCAFVTNELLREKTSMTDEGILSKAVHNIKRLEDFKDTTFVELRTGTVGNLRTKLDEVIRELENVPFKARQNISDLTEAEDVISKAETLVESVEAINKSLTGVNEHTKSLIRDTIFLNTELATAKTNTMATLNGAGCSTAACNAIKQQVDQLKINTEYDNVDDVEMELAKINAILDNNLRGLVKKGRLEFEDIAGLILNDTQKQIDEVKEKKEEVLSELQDKLDKQIENINSAISLNGTYEAIEDMQVDTETYGNYRYYAGIGLSSILLLIVLLYYLGLCFGACGEVPGDDASCCNKGIGATVIMVSVAFTFLFCWLLMLVVFILFVAGGSVYTEACRPLSALDNNTLAILQDAISQFNGTDINVAKAVHDCRSGEGLYKAFDLRKYINLDDVLDITEYGIREKIDELVNNIDLSDLSTIEIISPETKKNLEDLRNSGLDNIDFNTYKNELTKAIVSPNVSVIVIDLRVLANQLTGQLKTDLSAHADTLNVLNTGRLQAMRDSAQALQASLNTLENEFIKAKDGSSAFTSKVDGLLASLTAAQSRIQSEGQQLIREFLQEYGDKIYISMEQYLKDTKKYIENDVGQCRPLYDIITSSIGIFCDDLLGPFNGFWFSIGWCVFFFIPCIIVAVCLVSLYRRTDDFDDYNRSFDEALVYPTSNRSRPY